MKLKLIDLIRIEYKKHKRKPYMIVIVIGTIICLLLSVFFSFIPKFDVNTSELNSITFILKMNAMFIIGLFSFVLGAMFVKYIINPYSELYLCKTLGYPVSRENIFLSKVLTCILFISTFCTISLITTDVILYYGNIIFKVVENDLKHSLFMYEIGNLIYTLITVIGIGCLSLATGWIKKSPVILMVTNFACYCMVGNQIQVNYIFIKIISILAALFIIAFSIIYLLKNVKKIEV